MILNKKTNNQFAIISQSILDYHLSSSEILVYKYFSLYRNKNTNTAYLPIKKITKDCKISKSSASKAIQVLIKKRIIKLVGTTFYYKKKIYKYINNNKNKQTIALSKEFCFEKNISGKTKQIYILFASFTKKKNNKFFLSYKEVKKRMRISRATIARLTKKLLDKKLIKKTDKFKTGKYRYYILSKTPLKSIDKINRRVSNLNIEESQNLDTKHIYNKHKYNYYYYSYRHNNNNIYYNNKNSNNYNNNLKNSKKELKVFLFNINLNKSRNTNIIEKVKKHESSLKNINFYLLGRKKLKINLKNVEKLNNTKKSEPVKIRKFILKEFWKIKRDLILLEKYKIETLKKQVLNRMVKIKKKGPKYILLINKVFFKSH